MFGGILYLKIRGSLSFHIYFLCCFLKDFFVNNSIKEELFSKRSFQPRDETLTDITTPCEWGPLHMGVIALKKYSTLPICQELEPPYVV